ncbi:MAG: hypothetical protein QQN41_10435, partial [Nitrosopumilus sp.]
FAHDLARGIKETIEMAENNNTHWNKIFHVVGSKNMSMFELAKLCPDSEDVQPFTLKEYYEANPNALKLTENMSLETIRHSKKYDLTIPGDE